MKAKEALTTLNITRVTLHHYVKNGFIKATKAKNGQYIYDDDSVYAFVGMKKKKTKKINISYSRVSTQNQKDQLKEQTIRIYESCILKGIQLDEQIEDIKSGMSFDRKGFKYICEQIIRGKVKLLIIENKDRLMRFGYEMFEHFFKYFGTSIIVLNDTVSNKSYEQELTEDLISIIDYFTIKSYSYRRKLNKIRRELEKEELKKGKKIGK